MGEKYKGCKDILLVKTRRERKLGERNGMFRGGMRQCEERRKGDLRRGLRKEKEEQN